MIRSFIAAILIMICSSVYGQYGLRAGYTVNSYDKWDKISDDFIPHHFELGINYWFRLKNQRVEFLPELVYGQSSTTDYIYQSENYTIKYSYLDVRFNTQFYLFDFKGDCDCPTFSKQGPSIFKGLFAHITPGIRLAYTKSTFPLGSSVNTNILPTLNAGVGLDIGLNDFITITPIAGIGINFNDHLKGNKYVDLEIENDTWNALLFSLRMSFRFDYINTPSWKR